MNKYALIIGIENYSLGSGQQQVKYAGNDAKQMTHYAQIAGFQLIGGGPLLDEHATYYNAIKMLDSMFDFVKPEDFVLIYYAGHGYYSEYGGYLIPYDYKKNNEINESNCISFDSINKRLQSKKPAKFVFFLDTCHSGFAGIQIDIRTERSLKSAKATKKARHIVKTEINNMVKTTRHNSFTGRVVFTSCSPQEKSRGIDPYKHGLYTYYLLEGLKSKANEPEIDITELLRLTKKEIISYSIEHSFKQTPLAYTYIQGEFYIPTYKTPIETIGKIPGAPGMGTKSLLKRVILKIKKFFYLFPWHKFKKFFFVLLGLLGIVLPIAVTSWLAKPGNRFGSIEGAETRGNTLIAFDTRGNQWRKNFNSKISRYAVADIDQDGKKDVLVGFASDGNEGGQVITFNRPGKETWRYLCTSPYPYPRQGKGELGVFDIKVFTENQEPVIAVLWGDQAWYQSVLVMLNPQGKQLKELWHPGHLQQIEKIENTYVVRAINNDLRVTPLSKNPHKNFSVLFGIKFENIYGEAPPYLGNARKNTHFEWYYVLSDQEESWGQIVPLKDRIRIPISCGLVLHINDRGEYNIGRADSYSCKDSLRIIRLQIQKE